VIHSPEVLDRCLAGFLARVVVVRRIPPESGDQHECSAEQKRRGKGVFSEPRCGRAKCSGEAGDKPSIHGDHSSWIEIEAALIGDVDADNI
jgi:hypothetical protein